MRIVTGLVVIALIALLGATLFYVYGVWTTIGGPETGAKHARTRIFG